MAIPTNPSSSDPKQPPVPTITSQVQANLPSLAEARQLEELLGARPSLWRRLQDFSGSSQMRTCFLFLPPALLLFTLFVTWPVVEAAYYSFFNWNGYGAPSKFIGLENFLKVLSDPIFYRSLFNNLLIILVSASIQVPMALALALLISDKSRSSVIFRAIFFLPYILGEIVAGLIWRYIYDGNYGVLAVVYRWFGQQAPDVLATEGWATAALLFGGDLEVFRLPHGALCRRQAGGGRRCAGGGKNRRSHPLGKHLEYHFAPDASGDRAVAVLQHPWCIAGFRHHRRVNRWWAIQFNSLGGVVSVQFWY